MLVWIQNPFDSLPTEGFRKQRYWLMAEAFAAAGHRVVYWTSDFSHAAKKRREIEGRVQQRNFRLVLLPTRPYFHNVGFRRVLSHRAYARTWLREGLALGASERPDVIIVSSPPVSAATAGRDLARRFGARFVVDLQDAWPETFYRLLPTGLRWLGRILLSGVRRAAADACRAADLVTGVCDRYEALAKGYGAANYRRAYLGIEIEDQRSEVRGPRGESGGIRLVYVGNMGVSYDLKTVMEGVRLMNRRGIPVSLDVAGFGGCVATDPAVRFHGLLKREELQDLLLNCDIGIVPMEADSFVGVPNKLAEYAAAGLRIVSSLEGETAKLIAGYRCGETYRSGDVQSFVTAVGKAAALGRDGAHALCEGEFDAGRIYPDYVRVVEKLV